MTGETDGPAGANGDDGDSRVLVVVEDEPNRRLLADFLGQRYTAVTTPGENGNDEYDLCVVDRAGLRRVTPLLERRREAGTPDFLPCLAVVPDAGGVPAGTASAEAVSRLEGGQYVDDVITTPVRKAELRRRTESLLRIRGLSLSLRSQEEQYRRLVELTPETILLVREGTVTYANRAGVTLLAGEDGSESELVGESLLTFVVPTDRDDVAAYLDRIREEGSTGEFLTARLETPAGEAVTEIAGTPVTTGDGTAIQLVVRDVTEREERERRLRLSQRAMDEASIGITIADAGQDDLPMLYTNAAFERITGYPTAESIGRNCRFLQGEDTDPDAVAAMREAIEGEEPVRTVVRNYRKDGTPFWNEVEITPVRDDSGAVTHYLGFQRDVTERIERERELEALHAATRELLAATTVGEICEVVTTTADEVLELPAAAVFLRDPDEDRLVPTVTTGSTRELFGELPTLSAGDSIAWDVFEDGEATIVDNVGDDDRAHNADTPVESELIVPLGDHGVFISGSIHADAFDDTDRQFVRTLGMNVTAALDRTDREQELRRRKRELERYETIVRATGEPIYTLDEAGNLEDANGAFLELVGYSREELIGEHVSVLMDEDDIARCEAVIADLVVGEEERADASIEIGIETAAGDWRRCLVNIALLPSEGGFRGTVGVLRDITERHRRAQRLEVMDRVLRHNLRNEMNVVRGRTEALRDLVPSEAAVHLEEILRSANALLSLSEGARRFHEAFHTDDEHLGRVDLVPEVEGAIEGFRTRFPDVTFETDLPASAPVRAHDAIRICIEELIENAVVHNDSESPTVSVSVTVEDGTVEVAVGDDGPGIPATERTTIDGELESALDHASGLGLWLVSWIVTSSGGEVSCGPNDPRGTVVSVRLRSAG